MKYIADNPVYQESYYRDARTTETERIAQHWPEAPIELHAQPGAIAGSLTELLLTRFPAEYWPAAAALIVFGGFLIGWYARGLFGMVWDNRGWAALLVFSVMGAAYMVNESNRKG